MSPRTNTPVALPPGLLLRVEDDDASTIHTAVTFHQVSKPPHLAHEQLHRGHQRVINQLLLSAIETPIRPLILLQLIQLRERPIENIIVFHGRTLSIARLVFTRSRWSARGARYACRSNMAGVL